MSIATCTHVCSRVNSSFGIVITLEKIKWVFVVPMQVRSLEKSTFLSCVYNEEPFRCACWLTKMFARQVFHIRCKILIRCPHFIWEPTTIKCVSLNSPGFVSIDRWDGEIVLAGWEGNCYLPKYSYIIRYSDTVVYSVIS